MKPTQLGKPIMIAEFGTLSIGGDRCEWYARALENFEGRFPLVRALLFFHVEADRTVPTRRWTGRSFQTAQR